METEIKTAPEAETENNAEPRISDELNKKLEKLSPYILEGIKDHIDQIPLPILEKMADRKPLTREELIRFRIPMRPHQMRELAVECIYQHLLLGKDIRRCLFEAMCGSNAVPEYLYQLTIGTISNEEAFREEIGAHLRKDWSFGRLSLVEQAILMMALEELEVLEQPKAVVINEAVTLAKQFCDDDSYKLINGVLDRI